MLRDFTHESEMVGIKGKQEVWLRWLVGGAALLSAGFAFAVEAQSDSPAAVEQQGKPLQFGLLPYVSTRTLFTYYAPMRHYLEQTLGRPVHMSTAPDFATYIARARAGDYDLYHTAPHLAAQAELEFGYRRVSRLLRELDGSILVARKGPIKGVGDLEGRSFETPDALAIITILGEQWLKDNGLRPGTDIEVRHSPTHNTAILAVARGDVEAAVTSAAVFENMPPSVVNRLRILSSTKKVPHMMFMAGPRLSADEYRQLREAMLAFTAKGAGKAFFAATGYGDMGPIEDEDMQRLSPFIIELDNKLQQRAQPSSSQAPTTKTAP